MPINPRLQVLTCGGAIKPRMLQELIQRLGAELEMTSEQLALAALGLAIGREPLLSTGDEEWIQQAAAGGGRRRGDRERGDRRRSDQFLS